MVSANDLPAHQRTYGSFIGLIKWTVPVILVTVLVVILLIS